MRGQYARSRVDAAAFGRGVRLGNHPAVSEVGGGGRRARPVVATFVWKSSSGRYYRPGISPNHDSFGNGDGRERWTRFVWWVLGIMRLFFGCSVRKGWRGVGL